MKNDIFSLKFDDLRRRMLAHPTAPKNLHKLVSAYTGTEEYISYMNLYTQPDNETVELFVEPESNLHTFYTIREIKEKVDLKPVTDPADDIPEVKAHYEVLRVLKETNTDEAVQTLTLVKLARPHVARMVGKAEYVDAEFVTVASAILKKTDVHGDFHYEETTVCVAEEDGTIHEAYLYFTPRALSIEEAMFAIGEV